MNIGHDGCITATLAQAFYDVLEVARVFHRRRGDPHNFATHRCQLDRLLDGHLRVERVFYERQILDIEERDIKHVADDQHRTARVNNFEQSNIQRFTPNSFYHCQHDVPAIEDRKGHHIYDREVHVQNHAKPEREPPT